MTTGAAALAGAGGIRSGLSCELYFVCLNLADRQFSGNMALGTRTSWWKLKPRETRLVIYLVFGNDVEFFKSGKML